MLAPKTVTIKPHLRSLTANVGLYKSIVEKKIIYFSQRCSEETQQVLWGTCPPGDSCGKPPWNSWKVCCLYKEQRKSLCFTIASILPAEVYYLISVSKELQRSTFFFLRRFRQQ